MSNMIERIQAQDPDRRRQFIVDTFVNAFGDSMSADAGAWRGKFRKMAATPFAFYRGSAALFYADVKDDEEPFVNEQTGRVWIQGDLHAENFGTYMNSRGIIVFDVNDFDEAYVAPFTWDLKRLAASLALIGYQKALSDDQIGQAIETVARSYAKQVARFVTREHEGDFALTLANTEGVLLEFIKQTRLRTRVGMLNTFTGIDGYDRRLRTTKHMQPLDDETQAKVLDAFEHYKTTIPHGKRFGATSYHVKDTAVYHGAGIGSAGLPSYSILLEGHTQALENDILIYMKEAQVAAPSRVIDDPEIREYFEHDGHRAAVSQRALQAHASPWLGHATIDGVGHLVAEVAPNEGDLEWDEVNAFDDILRLLEYMGQAVAKIHCVSDADSDQTLVNFSTDEAIHGVLEGREDDFVRSLVDFGDGYGELVRRDHGLFVDAFRNHEFLGL